MVNVKANMEDKRLHCRSMKEFLILTWWEKKGKSGHMT